MCLYKVRQFEDSGFSQSNMLHPKATKAPPENSIKPVGKFPDARQAITDGNVDIWKGFGTGLWSKTNTSDSGNSKLKASES